MVEVILHRLLDEARRLGGGELFLGLALELRIADEQRQQHARAAERILGVELVGLAVADHLGIAAQAARDDVAEAVLVGAALGGRNRVAVRREEPVVHVVGPDRRPLHRTHVVGKRRGSGERRRRQARAVAGDVGQVIRQAIGEMQGRARRGRIALGDQLGRATPAHRHAPEQIRLGAGHAIERGGAEAHPCAEDLRIGAEGHGGAAPVLHRARIHQRPERQPARKRLGVEPAVARHLDDERRRQCVHHRNPDAMQAARNLVGVATELAARVQRGENHFERRLVRILRMRVHRNATPVVAHRHRAIGQQFHVDDARMAGNRLVHRVVEDFGHQMVHRTLVGAADIHARTTAHRLQPLKNLDVLGGVGFGLGQRHVLEQITHRATGLPDKNLSMGAQPPPTHQTLGPGGTVRAKARQDKARASPPGPTKGRRPLDPVHFGFSRVSAITHPARRRLMALRAKPTGFGAQGQSP